MSIFKVYLIKLQKGLIKFRTWETKMAVTIDELLEACKKYEENEGRASYYNIAVEIADSFPLQATVLLLATWNTSRFRYFLGNNENLVKLENVLENSKHFVNKLKQNNLTIQNADFDKISEIVKKLYSELSAIPGVEFTGASKVIHLLNRDVFVMWDEKIRKAYSVGKGADDYFGFLKMMQTEFGHINWNKPHKTLAKAIDEYNYTKYSLNK